VKIPLRKRYHLELGQSLNTPVATPDKGWLINFDEGPEVVRLDAKLNELWRKDLQAQNEEYVRCRLSVSPNNRLMALAARESVRITDGMGNPLYVFPHAPWYSFCGTEGYFSEDSRYLWFVTPTTQEEDDLLHVMDTATFRVLGRISINNRYCAYHFHQTPQTGKVLIEAAAGQDECILYVAQLIDGRIELEELTTCEDRVMSSFSASGKEFVTAPHGDGVIKVYSFPVVREIAALDQEQIFRAVDEDSDVEEDMLDYLVKYLTDDFIISNTRYGRLLLIDRRSMQLAGELAPEGYQLKGYDKNGKYTDDPARIISYEGDISDFFPTSLGEILIVHGGGFLAVYDNSEVLKMR
jgi:hypothetical protein